MPAAEWLELLCKHIRDHYEHPVRHIGQCSVQIDRVSHPSVAQHIASGRLRALAVTSGKRVNSMPSVPTAKESGLPDYEVSSWYAVFAPAGTPPNVVARLNAAFNQIVLMPDVAPRLTQIGAEPVTSSVDEFVCFYRSEVVRWKDVVTRAKIPLID